MGAIEKMLDGELERLGIWAGEERARQAYVLSPSAYRITPARRAALDAVACAVSGTYKGLPILDGLLRSRTNLKNEERSILSYFDDAHQGVPRARPVEYMLPPIIKVDLVETSDGYRIAEIDGYNPRGLPYPMLLRHLYSTAVDPSARFLEGTVAPTVDMQSHLPGERLDFLIADKERFYRPAIAFYVEQLRGAEVDACLRIESETSLADLGTALMIFPKMDRNTALRSELQAAYLEGKVDFHFPPRPYLGSKLMLSLISNFGRDERVEALLGSCICSDALYALRALVPDTLAISKRNRRVGEEFVRAGALLKSANGSGMKGVHFSDEADFTAKLEQAYGFNRPQFVLQREVEQVAEPHAYFSGGEEKVDHWYLRICAYVDTKSATIADIDVTGRSVKQVHGAKDCIQLPGILVD